MERGHGAILVLSRFSDLARFNFLYRLKPVFAPFQTLSWPFLYYSSIISRYVPLPTQPLDHIGPSPVYKPMGGLYSWQGDAKDYFVQCVCSLMWEQVKQCCEQGESTRCAACQEEEKNQRSRRKEGRGGGDEIQPRLPVAAGHL